MAALACNVPFVVTESQATQTAVGVQSLAAQTIAAQQQVASSTALSQAAEATATAAVVIATRKHSLLTPPTLISVEATAQAGSASATYAAQVSRLPLCSGSSGYRLRPVCPCDRLWFRHRLHRPHLRRLRRRLRHLHRLHHLHRHRPTSTPEQLYSYQLPFRRHICQRRWAAQEG